MRYVAPWVLGVLGWLGTSSVVVGLAACSLTSLAGLTSDGDGGAASTTGEVMSSGGSSSSGGGGPSSSGGSSSGGGGLSSSGASSSGGSGVSSSGGGGGNDGGESPTDDADAEAGNPVPQTDASGSDDAGSEDTGTGSSPPSTFCASLSPAPLFCDDFDEGALAAPWDQLSNTNGSEKLSTASYVSAPYAMLVTVDPNTPVTAIDVAGYKSFTGEQGATGTATLSFDIRVDSADESSSSDGILGAIQLWNGSAYWDLELEVFYASGTNDFTISMSEDGNGSGSYVKHSVTPHLALGTWTTVTLAIALPAGSGGATAATMALNGTTVANDTVHVSTSNPIPEVLVGTTFATPTSGGWTVAYDNVTFDER